MSDPGTPESSDLRALACAVLDAMLAGDRRPFAIVHPLEFACIPILRTPGLGVCGHIWQDGRSAPTVHCHSWHLDSEVVAGALRNEIFTVTDRPDGDRHLLSVDSTGPVDRVIPTGRIVAVRSEQRTLHEEGSSYSLPAGIFHRSRPASTPTLTLLAARTVPGAHDQIVTAHPGRRQATRRRELPTPAARTLVALLRSALFSPAHEPAGTRPHRFPVPAPRYRAGRT